MNKAQKAATAAQLKSEAQCVKEIGAAYDQALKDIRKNIERLEQREQTRSVIYRQKYQKALEKQVSDIIDNMQKGQYQTISDYLTGSYENGYVGAMYDIAQQGVPVVAPIQQPNVAKAVQTDSKLSKTLYQAMGMYLKPLKKKVTQELTRGFAAAMHVNDIARNIAQRTRIGYSNAIRIARTEGHRINCAAAMDAQRAAKERGADVVKQWDATLDGRTRKSHRKLDGQIRELDEPFEANGHKADAPGHFGRPEEDINCRCVVLQRARWALDDDELETLKERAAYFGLDKTKDFDDFKAKYLKITEKDIEESTASDRVYEGTAFADSAKDIYGKDYKKALDGIYDRLDNAQHAGAATVWRSLFGRVKMNKTGSGAFYRPGTGGIHLAPKYRTLDGDSLGKPFQTVFHEVGHAIDDWLDGDEFSYGAKFTKGGALGKAIRADWEKLTKTSGGIEDLWKANKTGSAIYDRYKDTAEFRYIDMDSKIENLKRRVAISFGDDVAEKYERAWYFTPDFLITVSAKRKKELFGDHLAARYVSYLPTKSKLRKHDERIATDTAIAQIKEKGGDIKAYGDISDWIEALTDRPYPLGAGHGKSYWTRGAKYGGKTKDEARMDELSSEAFAELFDSCLGNEESYKLMRKYFPSAVEWFEEKMDEVAKRWTSTQD